MTTNLLERDNTDTRPEFRFFTMKIGTYSSRAALKAAVGRVNGHVDDDANKLLNHDDFTVADEETEIDFVVPTVGELGFKTAAAYADICARAQELGFQLCPVETGPQLYIQFTGQPLHTRLRIATEPLAGLPGLRGIFKIYRNAGNDFIRDTHRGRRGLSSGFGRGDGLCSSDDRFAFVRPRR